MTSTPSSHPLQPAQWHRSEPLTGDASPRRYIRVWASDGETAILVEYPAPIRDQLAVDLEVFSWCRRRGLRVPDLLAWDLPSGRALLEDLGAEDAEATLASASADRRSELVAGMLRPLMVLAECGIDELPAWNLPLDRRRLRWELAGFELWYLRHFRAKDPSTVVSRWLDDLADEIGNHPRRVCHRDYHLNNLLVQDNGEIAVIDIQDILVGPDTYDVVSLVAERAAIRLISQDLRLLVMETWARNTAAEPGWPERATMVQIQRGLKVLGTFARFTLAGRSEYHRWLTELEDDLAVTLAAVGTPQEIVALLLD